MALSISEEGLQDNIRVTPRFQSEPGAVAFAKDVLNAAESLYGAAYLDPDQPQIDPDTFVSPNWACIWNKIDLIGTRGQVVATNGRFCIVIFKQLVEPPACVYRCEDLDIINT